MRTRILRPPRWRAPFLRALATTGNVQLACEKALVHQSYVYRFRAKDPNFAADMASARAEALAHLSTHESATPSKGLWHSDGSGLAITSRRNGAPYRAERARTYRWTRKDELTFLDTLASTCNVTLACEAAGHHTSSAYARRRRWPAFAKEWRVAIENAAQALQLKMMADTLERMENGHLGIPDDIAYTTVENAIKLVGYHQKYAAREKRAWNRNPVDPDAIRASILRRLDAIEWEEERSSRNG